jgi:hypothetical protein
MKPCSCKICKQGRRFYQIIKALPPSQQKWMRQFYNEFMHISEDLEYQNNILAGTWPSAVRQLTAALENAKKIQGEN